MPGNFGFIYPTCQEKWEKKLSDKIADMIGLTDVITRIVR